MRREEKRKRFHEALLKTLYPSPSQPESEEEEEKKQVITSERALNVGLQNSESKSSSPKTDDEDEGRQAEPETQKLSRSQRKRLRKRKLKEDASRRGNIIGPLLPSSRFDGAGGPLQVEPQGVRQNARQEQAASRDKPDDEQANCSSKKKLKQRRIAKRMAKEGLESNKSEHSDT
ncbi:hypothetical protein V6N11_002130 [Hibiscus sabdariffa]|uniref:Uncharacterized protein n=1 Tax=Hibiscus sabdariffa TaxID=183260 RepID=A0ABR2QUQ1_9ROSI